MTDVTCGAGTANPSGEPAFTANFKWWFVLLNL